MAKYIFLATYSDEGAKGIVGGDSDRVAAMEACLLYTSDAADE